MSISQEIRDAIRAARTASATRPDDPFKQVLEEVAQGLTDDTVEARFTSAPGGSWTLRLSPAHQPGRSATMLEVVISTMGAQVLVRPEQFAKTPAELADILKKLVTSPAFLESLEEVAKLSTQPVEGFLRMAPRTVSREDLMLEVPPEVQRELAERVNSEVALRLRIADSPGAGKLKSGARYSVLESAGFSVTLSEEVAQEADGALRIIGRVTLTVAP